MVFIKKNEHLMNHIEQQAIQTYQSNLKFLEQSHPALFEKLIIFEEALTSGQYPERYSLEYKNNYFDVLEALTGIPLYGSDPKHYTQYLFDSLDYKRTGGVFEGQVRFDIDESALIELEKESNINSSLWATAKIIHYNARFAPKSSSEMVKLYKIIFLGTGLGLHIKPILDQTNSEVVYIQENDLELFRLSLFTTNYTSISAGRKLFLSIAEPFNEKQHTFFLFLNQLFNHNLYIKHIPFYSEYSNDLKELQSITLSQNHITYPYQAYMSRSFSAAQKVINEKYFFNISNLYSDTIFSQKSILMLGAGPSLQTHTKWLQRYQDRFIILTVLSACKHLQTHGIVPDIIVHIDPQETSLQLLEGMDMETFFHSTLFILGSSVHESVVNKIGSAPMFFIESDTSFKQDYGKFTLPSVGEYTAVLSLLLGSSSLYLIGLDQSLDPETMKDHIDLHVASQTIPDALNDDSESVEFQKSIFYVKGNFLDIVPTKANFRLSITQFDKAMQVYKQPDQMIYNLANGAYLPHTNPLRITEIPIDSFPHINKETLKSDLLNFFIGNSSNIFRFEDRTYIDSQIQRAKTIRAKIKKLRTKKIKEPQNYITDRLLPFASEIAELSSEVKSDIGEIYFEYFKIVLSFACDIFNTKKLPNLKLRAHEVDQIILNEVDRIAVYYVEKMQSFLEPKL